MRVVLYARVSSEKQDVDLSVASQLKALREYAAKNQHQIIKEYIDEAESGKTTHRPAFLDMISSARRTTRPFDIILVWKYSRFARSREDSIVYKTLLRKKGIRVISINEPAEDTPTGKLLEAMIECLDEFYIANLGEEVTRGMRESASRGFYISAQPPYGYRKIKVMDGQKERTRLDIQPNQANIVSRIFIEASNGKGQIEIVKLLNREGVAGPRNGGWKKTTIGKILTQEIYTGTLVWGRNSIRDLPPIRVENAYPAIVDRQTFDRVQKIVKDRAPMNIHPKRVASRFLLSGLAHCGHCGKALVGQDAKSGKFSYYVCGTLLKKGSEACHTRYLNSQRFENLVVSKIKEHILTTDNLTRLVTLINQEMDSLSGEYQQNLEQVIGEMADVDHRLERLYDALETGQIKLADLALRIQQLRLRKENLQATRWDLELQLSERRVELADADTVAAYVADLRNLLNEGSLAERKTFIRSFIKEIKITDNEVLLSYTTPIQAGGITEEKLPVLSIEHSGGR